jgi:hypothetical protein
MNSTVARFHLPAATLMATWTVAVASSSCRSSTDATKALTSAGDARVMAGASPVAIDAARSPAPGVARADATAPSSAVQSGAGDAGRTRTVAVTAGVRAAVCGKRQPCDVYRVRDAGADSQGRALRVVTVDRGLTPPQDGEPRTPPDPNTEPITSEDEGDETEGPGSFGQGCHRYEFWLMAGAAPPQLLYESCNDGYGAAMVGTDGIRVGDGEVTVSRAGGSNWRWDSTSHLGLDPVHVRSTEGIGTFAGGGHTEEERWSWDEFRGDVQWVAPACDADGSPPQTDDADLKAYRYVAIPQVKVEPEFDHGGWRSTRLGECAAHVDSSGTGGFVTYGGAGAADDASFAAVASTDGVLFLELHDDRWTGPSDHWIADDHVELWLAAEPLTYMEACIPRRDDAPPKQWAIRTADGRVFAGYGNPAPAELAAERVAADGSVRMRIVLPHDSHAITVVYSDGDDGGHQKRLIATSALKFGDRATLGELHKVSPDAAVCTARGGTLRPRATRRLARTKAVVGQDE